MVPGTSESLKPFLASWQDVAYLYVLGEFTAAILAMRPVVTDRVERDTRVARGHMIAAPALPA